jgi:hypothetical protein
VARRGRWTVTLALAILGHLAVLSLMMQRGREPPAPQQIEPLQVELVPLPRQPPTVARQPPRRMASSAPPILHRAPEPDEPAVTTQAAATPTTSELMAAPFAGASGHRRLKMDLPACDPGGLYPPGSGHEPCPKAPEGPVISLDSDPANGGFAKEARRKAALRDYRDHLGSPYPGLLCAIGHRCR